MSQQIPQIQVGLGHQVGVPGHNGISRRTTNGIEGTHAPAGSQLPVVFGAKGDKTNTVPLFESHVGQQEGRNERVHRRRS